MNNFFDFIKQRSRNEWLEYYKDKWISFRVWVQEHGEISAVYALIFGIFLVLAFKLVLSLAILLAILAAAIWLMAEPKE